MSINIAQVEQYIRQAAMKRGIDPDTAVRVARSEGLAPGTWQSNVVKNGKRERSYGPFQLYMDGGLGNKFMKQTGLDPRDPSTVYQQVDFALDQASQTGWSPWYGAAKVGVNKWDGLRGAQPAGVSNQLTPEQREFVQNNPQPGGFGPEVENMMAMPFGSMAPGGAVSPFSIPPDVANYATSADISVGDRLAGLGAGLSQAMGGVSAPRPSPHPGGPSGEQASALTRWMENPQAIMQAFLKRRMIA